MNRVEKMNHWWIVPLLRFSIRGSVRRELAGLWLRGEVPAGGVVLAANHHSWWDAYLLGEVAASLGQPCSFLMTARQLARFPFLRLVGAVPPRELRSLIKAARKGHWVVLFPEGEIRPQGQLIDIQAGAGWLAQQASVPLIPVAVRVVMRGSQKPEAFVRFGAACAGADLRESLNAALAQLDADLWHAPPDQSPAGYLLWRRGRASRHDRVDLPSRLLARLAGLTSQD